MSNQTIIDKQLSIMIPVNDENIKLLEQLSTRLNLQSSDTILKALLTTDFILTQQQQGWDIILRKGKIEQKLTKLYTNIKRDVQN